MPPSPRFEVDLDCFMFGSNARFNSNGSSSLKVGEHISTGMTISGTVKRIVYDGTVALRIEMNVGEGQPSRFLRLFDSGLMAEEAAQ